MYLLSRCGSKKVTAVVGFVPGGTAPRLTQRTLGFTNWSANSTLCKPGRIRATSQGQPLRESSVARVLGLEQSLPKPLGREPAYGRVEDRVRRFREFGCNAIYFFRGTVISIIVIVSLPKMATTLTASFRRRGEHSRRSRCSGRSMPGI